MTNRRITAILPEVTAGRIADRAAFKRSTQSREIHEALRFYYKRLDQHIDEWLAVLVVGDLEFLARWLPRDVEIMPLMIPALIENALWDDGKKAYRPEKEEFAHLLNRIRKSTEIDKQALCDLIRATRDKKC